MPRGDLSRRVNLYVYRTLRWGQNHVPPGLRSLIGFMFMVGGVFGFLPVLGFWMFPLGLAFVAMDVPPARRRLDVWVDRLEHRLRQGAAGPRDPDQPPDGGDSTSSQ
jgi:hypothetical protein